MMSLWDALRMNMMISYQELVRTFLNVRGTDGSSTAIYSVAPGNAVPSTWTFYSRMQRVNNALPPESGMVRSQVIVNVSYE
ncbi:fimbrial protein [Escherichia coli]|nr:fimbrial protein [Escherichia coli]